MNNSTLVTAAPSLIWDAGSATRRVEGQCDACSPLIATLDGGAKTGTWDPHYRLHPGLVSTRLAGSRYHAVLAPVAGAFALVDEQVLQTLREGGGHDAQDYEFLPEFLDPVVPQRMADLGLLVPEGYTPRWQERAETLTAWLHVTDRCNLRCSYCYLPHHPLDMSVETGQAAVSATIRSALRHGYRRVKLKYAGGEPLLRPSFCLELHRFAQVMAERAGLELDGVVISNGTRLTPATLAHLQQVGLRLTLSLDSLDPHQCQRTYPGGGSSIPDVVRQIEASLACGLKPDISVTVSPETVAALPDLVAWLLARGLVFHLNLCRPPTQGDPWHSPETEARLVEGLGAAYRVIENHLPDYGLLGLLADRVDLGTPHLRACSVGHSYLVYDPGGRVAKCQMDMTACVSDARRPDPLGDVRSSAGGIRNLAVDEKAECRACDWRYWCAGGCPLIAHRSVTGSKFLYCALYRKLFREILRLEGLRLLRAAGMPH